MYQMYRCTFKYYWNPSILRLYLIETHRRQRSYESIASYQFFTYWFVDPPFQRLIRMIRIKRIKSLIHPWYCIYLDVLFPYIHRYKHTRSSVWNGAFLYVPVPKTVQARNHHNSHIFHSQIRHHHPPPPPPPPPPPHPLYSWYTTYLLFYVC